MILFENVSKTFGKDKVLFDNVDLLIPSRLRIGIVGEAGSGKSTLLKLIAGSELPTRGTIHRSKGKLLWSDGTMQVMHPNMTLYQGLRFFGRLYSDEDEEMERILHEILEFSGTMEYRNVLWKDIPARLRPTLKFAMMSEVDVEYLLIEGALMPPNNDKTLSERLKRKMKKSTTFYTSPNLKQIEENCDAGIVLHQKGLHYFDNVRDAIEFHQKEIKK